MEQTRGRILVVDDEAAIRLTLGLLLQRHGYDTMTAADGAEALTLLGQHRFDLLLIDLMLPGMNGLEIARHAREQNAGATILILTGSTELEGSQDTLSERGFDYMFKTASPQDVLDRVQALICRRQAFQT